MASKARCRTRESERLVRRDGPPRPTPAPRLFRAPARPEVRRPAPAAGDLFAAYRRQRESFGSSPVGTVRRRTAAALAPLAPYAPGGDVPLYNIPGAVNLDQGVLFTRGLPPVADAGAAIDAYIVATGALGAGLAAVPALGALPGMRFLDVNREPPNVPGVANFGVAANSHPLDDFADMPRGSVHALGRPGALAFHDDLTRGNRHQSRNKVNLGLVDPFVTRLTIPQANAHDWVLDTNWSESAKGYITRVTVGSRNVTGRIRDAGDYAAAEDLRPGAHDFQYSSAHDLGTGQTVGEQIGGLQRPGWFSGPRNRESHAGFDAVTKIGAEGARFEPVRRLGLALKVDSRFFTLDHAGVMRALSFQQLYANWGRWFDRRYRTPTADVRDAVRARGAIVAGAIDLEHDYDLDNDGVPSRREGDIRDEIGAILDRLEPLERRRRGLVARRPTQHVQNQLRGLNRRIAVARDDLRPYQRAYPTLVALVRAARAGAGGAAVAAAAPPQGGLWGWWQWLWGGAG